MNRRTASLRSPGPQRSSVRTLLRLSSIAILASAIGHAELAERKDASVTGHVMNSANGQYLGKAVVRVEGTNIEVLTDDFGEYAIPRLPAGKHTLKVMYTGQETQSIALTLEPGAKLVQDVSMKEVQRLASDGSVIMETFKVEADRFKNAQEIATNEERYSVNIKNVVAADSLGYVADGNVGDFVKFLPGVDVSGPSDSYSIKTDSANVSVRGFGPENTAITIDGMPVSSPSPGSLTNAVGLDMMSINNASRIEVVKVATPDMDNNSAGGSINLVSRSAFEFAKPQYSMDLTFALNTRDTRVFKMGPGPLNHDTYHTLPGARFSVSYPINKKLGVTFSIASDNKYAPYNSYSSGFAQTKNATVVNALGAVDFNNPYLNKVTLNDQPFNTFRNSGNLKIDFRPFRDLTLSTNLQFSSFRGVNVNRRLTYTAGTPSDWGADFTAGKLNTGTSNVNMWVEARDKTGTTTTGFFKAVYKRGPWGANFNASRSVGRGHFRDIDNGHFSNIEIQSTTGMINFLGTSDGMPANIITYDKTGNIVDYSTLSKWSIPDKIQVVSGQTDSEDINDRLTADLSRDLNFRWVGLNFKTGWSYSMKEARKWGEGTGHKYVYTGPSISASSIMDPSYKTSPGWKQPVQEWIDVYSLYGRFRTTPEYFDDNYDGGVMTGNYNSYINQNKMVNTKSHSYYGMVSARFLKNRVSLVGGVRRQESTMTGYQPIMDKNFNLVKKSDGTVYTDAIYYKGVTFDGSQVDIIDPGTGLKVKAAKDAVLTDTALIARMKAAGAIMPDHIAWAHMGSTLYGPSGLVGTAGSASNNLELAKLYRAQKYIKKSRANPPTPSLSSSVRLTKQLSLKTSWSRETTLPNLEDAGTSGAGTVGALATNGNFTISQNFPPTGELGGDGTIKASNPGLKPMVTNSYNVSLSYYTNSGGNITGSYYFKETQDIWESVVLTNDDPEFEGLLDAFNLDRSAYHNYTIQTTDNGLSKTHSYGYEIDARQNLGKLFNFGKRMDLFATYSHRSMEATKFTDGVLGQVQLTNRDKYTGGFSIGFNRFTVQLRGIYRNGGYVSKGTQFTYNGQKYMYYTYTPDEIAINLQTSVRLTKTYSAFVSMSNLLNRQPYKRVLDPVTGIMPAYSHIQSGTDNGMIINFGISGRW